MTQKPTFWERIGLHEWFIRKDPEAAGETQRRLTPNELFHYIIKKFEESIQELSFANRIVFYHEYIISFNPDDYREFMENKRGIFGLIVQESVTRFYDILQDLRSQGKIVQPSSSKWVFRFASNSTYTPGDKSFIGKLLPGNVHQQDNLRVTFIPRHTGIARTFDINPDILQGFNFYSDSYYEVPYRESLSAQPNDVQNRPQGRARLETIIPEKEFAGRRLEYLMKEDDILVSGKDETRETGGIFRIPTEWVNTPHLRIQFNKKEDRFYLASFGEKTLVNEKEVVRSDVNNPVWTELPLNSKIMLNGIVGINIFKS